MNIQEFSNEFDTLLNSYSTSPIGEVLSKADIVLDEYEKSVLLTQAQEEVVKGLYNGSLTGESFENTEEIRRYLDNLINTSILNPSEKNLIGVDTNSIFFELPDDLWFITYEQAVTSGSNLKIIPMRQDEWHRSKDNPFKKPNNKKAIRIDNGNGIVEIISTTAINTYLVRYISRPTPIILVELPEDLSINGEHNITECKLHTALHRVILERAVQLAFRRFPQARK